MGATLNDVSFYAEDENPEAYYHGEKKFFSGYQQLWTNLDPKKALAIQILITKIGAPFTNLPCAVTSPN